MILWKAHFSILCDKTEANENSSHCGFVKEHFSSCEGSWSDQKALRKHASSWNEQKGCESARILEPPFWKHEHSYKGVKLACFWNYGSN